MAARVRTDMKNAAGSKASGADDRYFELRSGDYTAIRRGNFQPGRTKWQV
jgi:hypothetical protein